MLALWEALDGKAPVAYRDKKVLIARRYTRMSLARSCAQLLPVLFHRCVEGYSPRLHAIMGNGQSWNHSDITEEEDSDVLGDSIYQFFFVQERGVYLKMLKAKKLL